MKPMIRRLRLLEETLQVSVYVEREDSPAAILRARRLRRWQIEGGVPPEPRQHIRYPRGTTIADILRQGRQRTNTKRIEDAEGLDAAQTN
jgi:hypothetical protein